MREVWNCPVRDIHCPSILRESFSDVSGLPYDGLPYDDALTCSLPESAVARHRGGLNNWALRRLPDELEIELHQNQ